MLVAPSSGAAALSTLWSYLRSNSLGLCCSHTYSWLDADVNYAAGATKHAIMLNLPNQAPPTPTSKVRSFAVDMPEWVSGACSWAP